MTPGCIYIIRPHIENKAIKLLMDFEDSKLGLNFAILSPIIKIVTFMLCRYYILIDWTAIDLAFENTIDSYSLVAEPLCRIYATALGN